ncbi:MAG: hypothetical protein ACSHX5_01720 [Phycisphaerales bacterium]
MIQNTENQSNQIVATTQEAQFILPDLAIWIFFIGFGFVLAGAAMFYAFRRRQDPLAYVKGLVGGSSISVILAALGAQVGGENRLGITWLDAVVISGIGFVGGSIFIGILVAFLIEYYVTKPLLKRYGIGYGIRVRLAALTGTEQFRDLLSKIARRHDADAVWDEFSIAMRYFFDEMEFIGEISSLLPAATVQSEVENEDIELAFDVFEEDALDYLRICLSEPLKNLASKLTRTSINFSIWRISDTTPELIHLVSFPKEKLHAQKRPLPIWKDSKSRLQPGSLAGESLIKGQYLSVAISSKKQPKYLKDKLIRRNYGKAYDAIGCMPLPLDNAESPWGILSVVNYDGTIPLHSESMKAVMDTLANVVEETGYAAGHRTFSELLSDDQRIDHERHAVTNSNVGTD